MKKIFLILIVVTLGFIFWRSAKQNESAEQPLPVQENTEDNGSPFSLVAQNLEIPWAIAFLPASPAGGPDERILFTERSGKVRIVEKDGLLKEVARIDKVKHIGEGGLLGIALHPNFDSNRFVYLYYTYSGDENQTLNRVARFKFENDVLTNEQIIVDKIPGAPNHNGGRIKFGPDGFLYITTGDAQNPSQAQDKNSLAGKILRITDEGKPVADNPFGNLVYSYGHRNPQGLAWDGDGKLWATEHGRSGAQSGLDELNLIEKGKNYGWPVIQGDQKQEGMVSPVIQSGPNVTWAPSGAVFYQGSIFFSGLRGEALFEYQIGEKLLKLFFANQFGRLREVIIGPDGFLYVSTSNRDGRGTPKEGDDKIIKIKPDLL